MATLDINLVESEYKQLLSDFSKFEIALRTQLEEILKNDIKLGFPIQSRVKTLESLIEKHESKRFNIKKSILELQDLIGFRIVLLFKRDIDVIISLIEQNFEIIKFYDTADKLKNDQFGYSSKHYIIKIKNEWANVPTFRGLENYTAEIQIRTLSQHNWAETSKVLQYKNESNVPREIIRTISRVSAFLEIVDLELERTLQEREKYAEQLNQQIDENLKLNVDVLSKLMSEIIPDYVLKDLDGYSTLLSELEYFDILTVGDLKNSVEKFIKFQENNILFYDAELKKWVEGDKLAKFDTSIIPYMLMCIDMKKYTDMIYYQTKYEQNSGL